MSKKLLIYSLPGALFLFQLLLMGCHSPQKEKNPPPNIILIIADDMAWDDSGAYGHPSIRTPNIDRLAREGMRFDRAFLTTSSCSPSRSSIITGKYPHQTGAQELHLPLPGDQVTFVEKLKAAGYWTASAGKWHLGEATKDKFDQVHVVGSLGFDLFPEFKQTNDSSLKNDPSGCKSWIPTLRSRPKDKPFFLWLAAIDPHRGYQPDIIENPHQPEDVRIPPYMPDNQEVRKDFTMYYDEISRMDSYIGKVLSEIDSQGIAENTLILFISDNGRPFPRDKTTLYDGGIKTPFIVRWPKKVKPGTSSQSLVSSVDIAATFSKLAGLEPEPGFEGVDFSPIFSNPDQKVRDIILAQAHWHDFDDHVRAIRNDRYKYIRNFYTDITLSPPADALKSPTFAALKKLRDSREITDAQNVIFRMPRPEEEFFDLDNDPYELNNLINDPTYSKEINLLRSRLSDFQRVSGDSLPLQRTPDEFDRETGDKLPNWQKSRKPKNNM